MQKNQYQYQTQVLRRCGLHAVNNLLQKEQYTRADFENIAEEFKQQTKQSHCTYFLGNYDLNVIERALNKQNFELTWVKPTQVISIELLSDQQVYGLLINVIKEKSFIEKICQWDPRHWISIRKNVDKDKLLGFYYNDSQQNASTYKTVENMIQILRDLQKNKENHILLVIKNEDINQQKQ